MFHSLIHLTISFSNVFGIFVNIIGAVVFISRILLKYLPCAKGPGRYQTFLNWLGHTSLHLGNLESKI